MKTSRVELTVGGRILAEVEIQSDIFQGDARSPLLLIIPMMPLNHILRKCSAGYKLSRLQEKINHLMYMDDIKLFAKNEKELETLIHAVRISSQDIGMEFGMEKCAMLVMKYSEMKRKQLRPGFELESSIPFPTTITVMRASSGHRSIFQCETKLSRLLKFLSSFRL